MKKLKICKAPGGDNVCAEMLQVEEQEMPQLLQLILQDVWNNEVLPDAWKRRTIIKLPKNGNLSECSNWRGITLLSITSKVFFRIILQRMKTAVDNLLCQNKQASGRDNHASTTSLCSARSLNSHMSGTALCA